MLREVLVSMLDACDGAEGKGETYEINESVTCAILTQAGSSGPAPINKVNGLTLSDVFVIVSSEDSSYYLPYENVVGLKVTTKGETKTGRTGFHA